LLQIESRDGRVTNESDSFIQEVDEKVREDRMMAILKRYGPWAGGLLAVSLICVFGWISFQDYQVSQSRKAAENFGAAVEQLQESDLDAASESFAQLANEGPQIYRSMAMMESAAILQVQGDLDGAIAAFDAAAEASPDPIARDSARMRAAYIAAETQDFQALRARLAPLIDSDTPFSFLARELLGVEAWEAGDADLARETLQNLTLAFDAPESVRQRAQLVLSVVGPAEDSAPETEATPEAPAGETE
jgi:hypothetical protein